MASRQKGAPRARFLAFYDIYFKFGHAGEDAKTDQSDAVGAEAGRRRRPKKSRRFETRHARFAQENAQGGSEPVETLSTADGAVMEFADGALDFPELLRRRGLHPSPPALSKIDTAMPGAEPPPLTKATTILAFKFADGVLVAGDRRATAGNLVVSDRADKVLEIDRFSLMAIAGVPATAWEMARVLEHSFQFYRRSQLQEMSLDGKVRALSKLLRDNLGFVMQGVGIVVPIFATFDKAQRMARLYFYDAMGAQFEAADFAATGSGSHSVRSILHYENTWGKRKLRDLPKGEAVVLALRALDTAAESDTATGGVDRRGASYPIVKIVAESGLSTLPDDELARLYKTKIS
jgi:proteasome beta subunit